MVLKLEVEGRREERGGVVFFRPLPPSPPCPIKSDRNGWLSRGMLRKVGWEEEEEEELTRGRNIKKRS